MSMENNFTIPEFELLIEKVMLKLGDTEDYDRDKTKSIIRALCKVMNENEDETISTMKFKSFTVNELEKSISVI